MRKVGNLTQRIERDFRMVVWSKLPTYGGISHRELKVKEAAKRWPDLLDANLTQRIESRPPAQNVVTAIRESHTEN